MTAAVDYKLRQVINLLNEKGYPIDKRPYKLNIAGIRDSKDTDSLTFDDTLAFWYYDEKGNLFGKAVRGTTSPSKYWLNNPLTKLGTAILKTGYYPDTYKIGIHNGKKISYEALIQNKKVTVIRDNDRNNYLDFNNKTENGFFGINIHRASKGKQNKSIISFDSAGCQVFENPADFEEMMKLARNSRDRYGNVFSYSLIDMRDDVKKKIFSVGILGAAAAFALFLSKNK